jgi:predicted O-methyltransferase YrrM
MFQSIPRRAVQQFRYARAMQKAKNQSTHPTGRRILSAINRAQRGEFTAEEESAFAAIEGRRASLLAETKSIPTIDYGAGGLNPMLSKEQQEAGMESNFTVSQIASASKPAQWDRILYELINEFRPSHVVEMGTCVGISGSYMAHALRQNGGRLTTLEGSPTVYKLASETFRTLGYDNVDQVQGRFAETLVPALKNKSSQIVFVDGHHDGDATINYFNEMLPYLGSGSLIVFDDIMWSPGMTASWKHVSSHHRIADAIDLTSMGVVALL